ncbi:hypothetical protein CcaCcLH18_14095 [Colletotrichum camelliae]|nr:hypothetical protein CcaCcLH18_14095 [Colletotrichum camelliae]
MGLLDRRWHTFQRVSAAFRATRRQVAPRTESVYEQLAPVDGRDAGALERSERGSRGAAGRRLVATCLLLGWADAAGTGRWMSGRVRWLQSAVIFDSEQLASAASLVMLLQDQYSKIIVPSMPSARCMILVTRLFSEKGCHMQAGYGKAVIGRSIANASNGAETCCLYPGGHRE